MNRDNHKTFELFWEIFTNWRVFLDERYGKRISLISIYEYYYAHSRRRLCYRAWRRQLYGRSAPTEEFLVVVAQLEAYEVALALSKGGNATFAHYGLQHAAKRYFQHCGSSLSIIKALVLWAGLLAAALSAPSTAQARPFWTPDCGRPGAQEGRRRRNTSRPSKRYRGLQVGFGRCLSLRNSPVFRLWESRLLGRETSLAIVRRLPKATGWLAPSEHLFASGEGRLTCLVCRRGRPTTSTRQSQLLRI